MRRRRRQSDFRTKKEEDNYRTNHQIRVPKIRLVGDNFEQLSKIMGTPIEPGVYPIKAALDWANELEMDLVEISPKAVPPVCKIIDFQKFLYKKKKKEKELKSKTSKTVIKEIRFGPNTDEHDFEFKLKHAKKFLEEGSKVKSYVFFRGRTIIFKDRGELLLLKFLKELEDYGTAEALPKMEGKRMIVMVSPAKKFKK